MPEILQRFYDNEAVQASDFEAIGQYAGGSLDHVVLDAITANAFYTGLIVSQVNPSQISVAPGRLYKSGPVYASGATQGFSLVNLLPTTVGKVVCLVAWGNEVDGVPETRNFDIDVATGTMEPQSHSFTRLRVCNLSLVPGIESAAPVAPSISTGNLLIATLLLSPSGIVSITMNGRRGAPERGTGGAADQGSRRLSE